MFGIGKLFNYKLGRLFTESECIDIIKTLDIEDKLIVSDEFGDLDLSVYEMDFEDMDDSVVKTLIHKRLVHYTKIIGKGLDEVFFIKYCDDKLEMHPHYDGGLTTTLVYLNNDFKGGGTQFPLVGKTHHPQDYPPGHYIYYNSNTLLSYHGGLPVTEGIKYALVIRTQYISVLSFFTLLPYRIFRDVFFERLLRNIVVNKLFRKKS